MAVCDWEQMEEEALNPLLKRRYITGEHMTLAKFSLKKGCIVPAHAHANEQMSTVLDGKVEFVINGEKFVASAGQTVIMPPFSKHGVEALEDCELLEVFSPIRQDWVDGSDQYLRAS